MLLITAINKMNENNGFQCHAIQNGSKFKPKPFNSPESEKGKRVKRLSPRFRSQQFSQARNAEKYIDLGQPKSVAPGSGCSEPD